MNVSLGGLIKYYRIKKRLSQLDIAAALGWKDTSRLSKLEQERSGAPTRQTVEKIANVLGLDEIERNEFLYAANIPPAGEEIVEIRKLLKQFLEDWPYPAYIVDSFWRLVEFNKKFEQIFEIDSKLVTKIRNEKPNLLELVFDPAFSPQHLRRDWNDSDWMDFIENQVAHFKFEHHEDLGAKWMRELVRKLSKFPRFLESWKNIHSGTFTKNIGRYGFIKVAVNKNAKKKILRFHIFMSFCIRDRRFDVFLYTPADDLTYRFFNKTTSRH